MQLKDRLTVLAQPYISIPGLLRRSYQTPGRLFQAGCEWQKPSVVASAQETLVVVAKSYSGTSWPAQPLSRSGFDAAGAGLQTALGRDLFPARHSLRAVLYRCPA